MDLDKSDLVISWVNLFGNIFEQNQELLCEHNPHMKSILSSDVVGDFPIEMITNLRYNSK